MGEAYRTGVCLDIGLLNIGRVGKDQKGKDSESRDLSSPAQGRFADHSVCKRTCFRSRGDLPNTDVNGVKGKGEGCTEKSVSNCLRAKAGQSKFFTEKLVVEFPLLSPTTFVVVSDRVLRQLPRGGNSCRPIVVEEMDETAF